MPIEIPIEMIEIQEKLEEIRKQKQMIDFLTGDRNERKISCLLSI